MGFTENYKQHIDERAALGVPPLALDKNQVAEVVELLRGEKKANAELADLLENRVNPGVDDGAKVKAEYLAKILDNSEECASISKLDAVRMLGKMLGGYNVKPLIGALCGDDTSVAKAAANELKNTLLVYEA